MLRNFSLFSRFPLPWESRFPPPLLPPPVHLPPPFLPVSHPPVPPHKDVNVHWSRFAETFTRPTRASLVSQKPGIKAVRPKNWTKNILTRGFNTNSKLKLEFTKYMLCFYSATRPNFHIYNRTHILLRGSNLLFSFRYSILVGIV